MKGEPPLSSPTVYPGGGCLPHYCYEKGHIIEEGTHDHLLTAGERYADLYYPYFFTNL